MDLGNVAAWAALGLGLWNAFKTHSSSKASRRVEAIEALISDLRKIEIDAKRYWLTPAPESKAIGAEIRSDLRDFALHVKRVHAVLWSGVDADIVSLRKVVSGGDFEVASRTVTPASSMRVFQIESVVAGLMRKFHTRISEINPI